MPPNPPSTTSDSLIRKAFLAEAIANFLSFPLLTHPHQTLSLLLLHPSSITPSTILFARFFGGLIIGGLTTATLIGATDTRNGIESRRPTYLILGVGEVVLMSILAGETAKGGSREAALSVRGSVSAMGALAVILAWRGYVLFVRPELMGRYVEGKGSRDGGKGTSHGVVDVKDE